MDEFGKLLSQLVDARGIQAIAAVVALSTGLLLFNVLGVSDTLGVTGQVKVHRLWFAIPFVVSTALIVLDLFVLVGRLMREIGRWIQDVWVAYRYTPSVDEMIVLAYVRNQEPEWATLNSAHPLVKGLRKPLFLQIRFGIMWVSGDRQSFEITRRGKMLFRFHENAKSLKMDEVRAEKTLRAVI